MATKKADDTCTRCDAMCCKYVAIEIDKPTCRRDFEDIRWYVAHKNVEVFTEDGGWFVQFHTPCEKLLADNRCGIYETRPKICRSYSTDGCELTGDPDEKELLFTSPEQVDAYVKKTLKKKTKTSKKSVTASVKKKSEKKSARAKKTA
jgi:Fe-S-cluster containining protein